jgi:AmmeMemoRadiSam system protein B
LFRSHFVAEGGPGLPKYSENAAGLRAVLAPHIDYRRGGVSYAWAFKEVLERCDASLFVIIGTSHYSQERFTVTRQNFKTPLGIAPVDQAFVDQIETHYGDEIYNDPFAHYPEHSIELEVVYLQYLYENIRPFRIVPILVGSFRDCVEAEVSPTAQSDIRRMILALKEAEKAAGESVCYIISGDLAHIGPKFGDPEPVNEAQLTHSRSQDQELIRSAARLDLNAYFDRIAKEDDSRRICGLPPTVVALAAAEPASGRALDYGQYVHPQGHESVSFASIGFYR